MDVWFYFYFKHKDECAKEIREFIKNGSKLNFEVLNISKNVYLGRDSTNFRELYSYDISNVTDGLFVKAIASSNDPLSKGIRYELAEDGSDDSFSAITEDFIKENFNDEITGIISQSEPEVTFWKPSAEFLISEVDLNIFIDDVESNKPLKNIFLLAGYENSTAIKNAVLKLSKGQFRRKLATTLSEVTTKYVRKIWKHKIAFDIEISESGKCLVSIKDEGQKNIHDFHTMHARSDGFKQFISLILSLSIDTKKRNNKGNLILIDEPETHLHPSGIRDLQKELLDLGKDNYLFVSTHSPFLVDRNNKERNILIKKNSSAYTEKKLIRGEQDIRDDEVLDIAFGINVYKDLLLPHNILLEGASDKIILQKVLSKLGSSYGITNGIGSNIVSIASKLNHDDIAVLVLVDDDKEGRKYKENIVKIGGNYTECNVLTLRDLVGEAVNGSTIEDLLSQNFILGEFNKLYKKHFNENSKLELKEENPCVEQIKIYLKKNKKDDAEFLNSLKIEVSNNFKPTATSLNKDFRLLKALGEKLIEKLG